MSSYDLDHIEVNSFPERPAGVMAIAGLNFVVAAVVSIAALIVWLNIRANDISGEYSYLLDMAIASPKWFLVLSCIEIAVGLAAGIGLWRMKEWARKLAIALYGLNLFIFLWANFGNPVTGGTLFSVLVLAGSLVYLMVPSVSTSFEDFQSG